MTTAQRVVGALKLGAAGETIKVRVGQTVRIGRDDTNDVIINDPSVSRVHAAVSGSHTGLVLADLSSTNGTFVNGERIASMRDLGSGDLVDIGGSKLSVSIEAADALEGQLTGIKRAMTAQLRPISVSVLVASVYNFKELCQELPTQKLADLQFRWNSEVSRAVRRNGGQVDKIIGPALVAIWTAAEAEAQACAAVRTALEIHSERLTHPLGSSFPTCSGVRTCVAVSSGQGLRGVLGGASTDEDGFTILGDPTNIAFRIQELFSDVPNDLLIPEATQQLVEGQFNLQHVAKAPVGSEEEPVSLFTVA